MKLLIYGAGVIGDLYAAAFAEVWHNISRGDDSMERTVDLYAKYRLYWFLELFFPVMNVMNAVYNKYCTNRQRRMHRL